MLIFWYQLVACFSPIYSSSARHIFVANGHNVFKLTPVPYELQVQQLVQQQQYELAMQICVSVLFFAN